MSVRVGLLAVVAAAVLVFGAASGAAPPAAGAANVKVCGSGNGHGVGLSQYGAYGRAKAGQNHARILRSYYRGVSLKRYATDPQVRVLLGERSLSGSHTVRVPSGGKARLRNLKTGGTVALRPGNYRVQYLRGRGLYRVTDVSRRRGVGSYGGPVRFEARAGRLGYGGRSYRGRLQTQAAGGKLLLINRLRMESYLRGVVPGEMPASWHPEALKAQAVAARSYARATERGGAFDFYADTRDQVYGGASAEARATNRAVRATARVHAVRGGRPITAFFHSSAGGRTEDGAYVFSAAPYLKSVRDADSGGRSFEGRVRSPWTRWSGTLNAGGSPQLGIGSVTGVRVLERSPSGRAIRIEVTGTGGKKTVTGQYEVRYALKTNGLRRADGSSYPAGALPSARVSFGKTCG